MNINFNKPEGPKAQTNFYLYPFLFIAISSYVLSRAVNEINLINSEMVSVQLPIFINQL